MAKRIKKPLIRPELAREWLRRNEETGESPPQIAAKDRYDVRTVRKQIELVKQEREVREARSIVLRNALERHYDDLRNIAEKLNSQVLELDNIRSSPDDDFKETALRQHLPRSPIWSHMAKLEGLRSRREEQLQAVKSKVEQMTSTESRLTPLVNAGVNGVIPGIVLALTFEAGQWSHGWKGFNTNDNLIVELTGEGKVSPRYGAYHMGIMSEELFRKHEETLKKVLINLELKLRESEDYRDLEQTISEAGRLQGKLREELAVIRLRRIVPGRCKFCPI